MRARKYDCCLQFLYSNFSGFDILDVNSGRDVVLDVVPVRDDQVLGSNSCRFQRVSSEHSSVHPCTELMKATCVLRGLLLLFAKFTGQIGRQTLWNFT